MVNLYFIVTLIALTNAVELKTNKMIDLLREKEEENKNFGTKLLYKVNKYPQSK